MKPLYRCDYCSEIGTEEEIKKHEATCTKNYNLKSCWTCKHYGGIKSWKDINSLQVSCKLGVEISVNTVPQNCPSYERYKEDDKSPYAKLSRTIFGSYLFR